MFGQNLKGLRQNLGLTQAQLADRLKISASTVGMYEQGRREPDNEMLLRICKVLNTSTDYLLGISKYSMFSKREVDDVIKEFTKFIKEEDGLTFDGRPMNLLDREKMVAAIRVAAAIAVSNEILCD